MPEDTGHFDEGRWVAGPPGITEPHAETTSGASQPAGSLDEEIEQRVHEVAGQVSLAISGVFHLVKDLVTTEQGHQHLEKRVAEAGTALENLMNDIAREAEAALKGDPGDGDKNERK
jgi:hypothetical protein